MVQPRVPCPVLSDRLATGVDPTKGVPSGPWGAGPSRIRHAAGRRRGIASRVTFFERGAAAWIQAQIKSGKFGHATDAGCGHPGV